MEFALSVPKDFVDSQETSHPVGGMRSVSLRSALSERGDGNEQHAYFLSHFRKILNFASFFLISAISSRAYSFPS